MTQNDNEWTRLDELRATMHFKNWQWAAIILFYLWRVVSMPVPDSHYGLLGLAFGFVFLVIEAWLLKWLVRGAKGGLNALARGMSRIGVE